MQETGLNRSSIDKFYTQSNISEKCCNTINDIKLIENDDLVIEPSAGNGSFINYIKKLTNNYKFYDIDPEHSEIIKQDFLELNITHTNKIHIIGNPPFGRQSSLAKKFIKKCSLFADSISFILPKSFKKESFQKTFPLCYHLIYEIDLPEYSFLVNGDSHNVPCVFQIWKKENTDREIPEKEDPINFKFVKKEEGPDISFRRVGVYAGKVEKTTKNKSSQSHYFIKFLEKELINKLDKFQSIKFNFNNTVGAKSISKPEMIKEFNKIIRGY